MQLGEQLPVFLQRGAPSMAKVTLKDGGRVGSHEWGILLRWGCWSARTGPSPQNMLSVEKCNDSIYQWKTGTLIHESGLLLSACIGVRFSFAVQPSQSDEATRGSSLAASGGTPARVGTPWSSGQAGCPAWCDIASNSRQDRKRFCL